MQTVKLFISHPNLAGITCLSKFYIVGRIDTASHYHPHRYCAQWSSVQSHINSWGKHAFPAAYFMHPNLGQRAIMIP